MATAAPSHGEARDDDGDQALVRPPVGGRFWRDARRRRALAIADLAVAVLTSALVVSSSSGALWAALMLPLWVLFAKLLGLYDRDQRSIRPLTVDELPTLAAWVASCLAALGVLLSLAAAGSVTLSGAVLAWLAGTAAAGLLRALARWAWRRTTPPELTAILGEGELASDVGRKLELFSDMHLRYVGHRALPVGPWNGRSAKSLTPLVRGLDRVIVAAEHPDPELVGRLASACRSEHVKLSVASPLRGRAGAAPRVSEVADLPVLEYDTRDLSRSTLVLKRGFDVLLATMGLVVLAPLFPLATLAIRLGSPGPVIFSQRRAGRGAAPFTMFKLRTMFADAEAALPDLVRIEDLAEPVFKLRADPRVTRVGRVLRRFSLDELPQLVNVLRGEMSIVGPRPEQVELVARYREEDMFRLDAKPGMTGPMQVFGRGTLTFQERLAVELDYVENLSLGRDLSILLRTIPAVLRGTGAY